MYIYIYIHKLYIPLFLTKHRSIIICTQRNIVVILRGRSFLWAVYPVSHNGVDDLYTLPLGLFSQVLEVVPFPCRRTGTLTGKWTRWRVPVRMRRMQRAPRSPPMGISGPCLTSSTPTRSTRHSDSSLRTTGSLQSKCHNISLIHAWFVFEVFILCTVFILCSPHCSDLQSHAMMLIP